MGAGELVVPQHKNILIEVSEKAVVVSLGNYTELPEVKHDFIAGNPVFLLCQPKLFVGDRGPVGAELLIYDSRGKQHFPGKAGENKILLLLLAGKEGPSPFF